ncbi:MAG TPA: hypothetical protein VIK11_01635, partial [Tepidiformaceae bacterium]
EPIENRGQFGQGLNPDSSSGQGVRRPVAVEPDRDHVRCDRPFDIVADAIANERHLVRPEVQ